MTAGASDRSIGPTPGSRSADAGSSSPAVDRGEQVVRGVVAEAAVDAPDPGEVFAVARRPLHDAGEREVGEHEPGGDVEPFGGPLPPGRDLLGDAAPGAAELARALDAPPRGLGVGALPDAPAPLLAFVGGPLEPADRVEPLHELVVQREQVLDVGRGVHALLDAAAGGASSR